MRGKTVYVSVVLLLPVECYQAEPFLRQYALQLANAQPWEGYLYQEIPCHGGSLLFGCTHRSWSGLVDAIRVVYLNSSGHEISRRSWDSQVGDWQIILTILRPPSETATVRIELEPPVDYSGSVNIDHAFIIPVGEL